MLLVLYSIKEHLVQEAELTLSCWNESTNLEDLKGEGNGGPEENRRGSGRHIVGMVIVSGSYILIFN